MFRNLSKKQKTAGVIFLIIGFLINIYFIAGSIKYELYAMIVFWSVMLGVSLMSQLIILHRYISKRRASKKVEEAVS